MNFCLILLNWKRERGIKIDFTYPESVNLTKEMIDKIYATHTFLQDETKNEEFIEIDYKDQIIMSYFKKSMDPEEEHELLIFLTLANEKPEYFNLKLKVISFARNVFNISKEERKDYVINNIEAKFSKETQKKKILILGRASTGKSSIKKVIFEGKNPQEFLEESIEPTRGVSPSIYSWFDLTLGFFDTAGQELDVLLSDDQILSTAFENSDYIIYVFDYIIWNSQQQEIINEINNILRIIKTKSYNMKLILFCHKIDLIEKQKYGSKASQQIMDKYFQMQISGIRHKIEENFNLPIYFTSLYPKLIYNLYTAFCDILGKLSRQSLNIKSLIEGTIINFSKTMGFITNTKNNIVAQVISEDFNFELLNYVHNLTAQLNQTFLDMVENDNINYFLLSSYKGLTIIMKHLNLKELNIMNLICISETLTNDEIIDLATQCGIHIENIYTYY